MLFTLPLLLSCHTAVTPATVVIGPAQALGKADAVAAADLDDDGVDDVILITDGVAIWGDHRQELGGDVQAVTRTRVNGQPTALIGTGMGRTHRDAPARVWAIGPDGATILWEEAATRAQITALRDIDGRVFLARFVDARRVEGGWLDTTGAPGAALQTIGGGHMAMSLLPLPGDQLVVGRLYGERPRSDGDLRVTSPQGERPLPSLRGVRALASADLDADGQRDLLVADGWHSSYGKQAVPRVRLFQGPDMDGVRTIAVPDGDYAIFNLQVLGQGLDAAILAQGSAAVHLLVRDALGWSEHTVAPIPETGNAVPVHTAQGLAILVSGDPAQVVPVSW